MNLELVLTLTGLAIIDSASFSAFGVPVVLLLSSPKPPVVRMLTYLGTIMVFFVVVGIAIMFGLDAVLTSWSGLFETRPAYVAQLAIGVGLFALSFRIDSKKARGRPLVPRIPAGGGLQAMVALGLTTSLLEVATMIPYLAAIGILTAAGLSIVQAVPLLAWYTLVMVLPPIVMLIVRIVARDWLRPYLERVARWLETHSREMVGWTVGIVGFLLAVDAARHLGLLAVLSSATSGNSE